MQKAYLALFVIFIFLHLIFQIFPPPANFATPDLTITTFGFVSLVLFFITLILSGINRKKYSVLLFISTAAIFFTCFVYLNFSTSRLAANSPQLVNEQNHNERNPDPKPYTDFTDPRCVFFDYFHIVRSSPTEYVFTDYSPRPFGWGSFSVHYFPNTAHAVTEFNNQNYTDPHLLLLDLNSCTSLRFHTHKFSNPFFVPRVISISPDGNFILYEIYHDLDADVMDPRLLEDYTASDAAQNGLWIYSLPENHIQLVKKLAVDTNTATLSATWDQKSITITGINCPTFESCKINLK